MSKKRKSEKQPEQTKATKLRSKVIKLFHVFLNTYAEDIESGIEEGIYKASENVESRALIAEARETIAEFEAYAPAVYVRVQGGLVQGASATEVIAFNILDADKSDLADDNEVSEKDDEIKAWDAMIEEGTKNGDIIGVF